MTLMHQVLCGGELHINALCLRDHAGSAPNLVRLSHGIKAGDACDSAAGNHECAEYAEERGLAAAVRAEQTEDLCRTHIKRDPIERQATSVVMSQRIHLNGRVCCSVRFFFSNG